MEIEYNADLARNAFLVPAAHAREADIKRIIGSEYPHAVARWELRTDQPARELVLVIQNDDRQAEEPVSYEELRGNGKFDSKLNQMKDSLAHNGVWRAAVRKLMEDARAWCARWPNAPTVKGYSVWLNEDRSGKYELPALEINGEGLIMWVEPVAGWVVNPVWVERPPPVGSHRAIGRVDLGGPGGPIYLYCLEPNGEWTYQGNVLDPKSNPNLFY